MTNTNKDIIKNLIHFFIIQNLLGYYGLSISFNNKNVNTIFNNIIIIYKNMKLYQLIFVWCQKTLVFLRTIHYNA